MSRELKILYVEDDKENREGLIELLSGDIINGYEISMDGEESFIGCAKKVNNYHIFQISVVRREHITSPQFHYPQISHQILKIFSFQYRN